MHTAAEQPDAPNTTLLICRRQCTTRMELLPCLALLRLHIRSIHPYWRIATEQYADLVGSVKTTSTRAPHYRLLNFRAFRATL